MANIIIKGKNKYGKTFSEIESNLRKDGQRSMTDDQLDVTIKFKSGAKPEIEQTLKDVIALNNVSLSI